MSTNSKHTPGPWRAFGNAIYSPNDEHVVAKILHVGQVKKLDGEANARLIAAAPEMYTLLHQIWAMTDPGKDPKTCRCISELLARIEGGAV